jgi:hypothetical protein
MTAEIDGDFVVFLIGMRVNKLWKIQSWWPVFRAMRPMLKELDANPSLGCLGYTFGWPVIVQYWRSFDQLESYAKSRDQLHLPAWQKFQQDREPSARQRGHLARDLRYPRRLVRDGLFGHAAFWPGQGWPAGARQRSTRDGTAEDDRLR